MINELLGLMDVTDAALRAALASQDSGIETPEEHERLWAAVYAAQRAEKAGKAVFAAEHLPALAGVVFCQR